jgi:hypothetical protein
VSALFTALYERAKNCSCIRCGAIGVRLGEQDSKLVIDVLCHGCFERAPSAFKLTTAQDAFRDAVNAGCHPRIAQRIAEVRGGFKWTKGGR